MHTTSTWPCQGTHRQHRSAGTAAARARAPNINMTQERPPVLLLLLLLCCCSSTPVDAKRRIGEGEGEERERARESRACFAVDAHDVVDGVLSEKLGCVEAKVENHAEVARVVVVERKLEHERKGKEAHER